MISTLREQILNRRLVTLINTLHNLTPLPRCFSFKDLHLELQQLIHHRSGTLCIIYRDEQETQESEAQEDRGKGGDLSFRLERRGNIKLSMEISGEIKKEGASSNSI